MMEGDLNKLISADSNQYSVDHAAVLEQVKKRRDDFARMILLRDYREGVIAFLLMGFFAFRGWSSSSFALIFMGAMCGLVGSVIVLDRLKQRKLRPDVTASMHETVSASLEEVRHQVKMLRLVFWWYLLPLLLGFMAIYGSVAVQMKSFSTAAGGFLFSVALLVVVYLINQRVVTSSLLSRQNELERLLRSLVDNE